MSARRLIIEGRVQGVGFRWWAAGEAKALGLRGWVRNRRDGSVELLVIGPETALDRLAKHCAHGPPAAWVDRVSASTADDDGSAVFEMRPTV